MYPTKTKRVYPSITNAPYWRRIQAYLIDFVVILIVGIISFYAGDYFYTNSQLGQRNNADILALRLESGLYIADYENNPVMLTKDINTNNYEVIYLTRLEYFYTAANTHFDYTLSTYYVEDQAFDYYRDVLKEGDSSSLFTFDNTFPSLPYRFKTTLSADDKTEAWSRLYSTALRDFQQDPTYKAIDRALRDFVALNLTISAFVGTIIPWLFCPLFFGHGRSIGKFLTRLAVVNKDGYAVKHGQIVVRFLVFAIIETALNVYGFFIPLLLTSGVLTLTKNNRAIHDLVSGTYVVDAKMSRIFKSFAAEEAYYKSSESERLDNKTYFTEAPLPRNLPK